MGFARPGLDGVSGLSLEAFPELFLLDSIHKYIFYRWDQFFLMIELALSKGFGPCTDANINLFCLVVILQEENK